MIFERLFSGMGSRRTSRLDEEVGTFSLNHSQLYVGALKGEDGSLLPAISLLTTSLYDEGDGIGSVLLYVPERADAARLVKFLDALLRNEFPASFRFPTCATEFLLFDGRIEWHVSEFVSEWHGGGGFKGTLAGCGGHIITLESTKRLRACICEYFDVEPGRLG